MKKTVEVNNQKLKPGHVLTIHETAKYVAECIINEVYDRPNFYNNTLPLEQRDALNWIYFHDADSHDNSIEFNFYESNKTGVKMEDIKKVKLTKEVKDKLFYDLGCEMIYINFYECEYESDTEEGSPYPHNKLGEIHLSIFI